VRVRTANLAATGLVACLVVGALGGTASPTEVASGALGGVRITPTSSGPPAVIVAAPVKMKHTAIRVIATGVGPGAVKGQRVSYDFVMLNGRDGTEVQRSAADRPASARAGRQSAGDVVGAALVGKRAGSILILGAVASAGAERRTAVFGVRVGDPLVYGIQIRRLHDQLSKATGTAIAPAPGLPAVAQDAKGRPVIAATGAAPPAGLVVQPIILGAGPEIRPGDAVTIQDTAFEWDNGKMVLTTWLNGAPADIRLGSGQALSALDQGLVGQPVGSRLLIVAPPDLGFGPQGDAALGVSGTDTLVYVIDVLDAY
jgi:peptidylprolyl isomerase